MKAPNQFSLLKSKRFLPLFVTQAIGAFNDNALRNSIGILITYKLAVDQGFSASTFVQAGMALFILPFVLFSALAGQLADKFDKAVIARRIKLIEIFAMAFGAYALTQTNVMLDLGVLFFAGSLSAFFGPVKYGILPQYLDEDQLIAGNGLIEMGTFVTILLGNIVGGALILTTYGAEAIGALLVGLSVIAYYAACKMPSAPSQTSDHEIDWHLGRQTGKLLSYVHERPEIFWAVVGASWFWFLGTVILAQLPVFTHDILHGDQYVVLVFTAVFTIGIACGSMLTNSLLKGVVSARFVPFATLMISLFLIDSYFSSGAIQRLPRESDLITVGNFFTSFSAWRLTLDLFFIAFFGGIYAVPLNAIMQLRASPENRSRVIAANNLLNAMFMIIGSIASIILLKFMTTRGLFLTLGLANFIALYWAVRLLPSDLTASFARILLRLFFRVEVKGQENYYKSGPRTVIIANHTSLLDGILLSAFLPERATFAIDTRMAEKWWVKPAFALLKLAPIDSTSPLALRTLVETLKENNRVMIFPEGRLTTTGSLMKIYDGPAAIAQMAEAEILPVRIDGTQYSKLTYLKGKFRQRWFPKVTLTFLPPTKLPVPDGLRGAALRSFQADHLYDIMTEMMFTTSDTLDKPLFATLLHARDRIGGNHPIVEDVNRKPLTYNKLVMGSFVLGRKLAKLTPDQKHVALLLPNSNGTLLALFGLMSRGRTVAMLNFSTGSANMVSACQTAEIKTIITSRQFIEAAKMEESLELLQQKCQILYLEDIGKTISWQDKLYGLYTRFFNQSALKSAGANPDPDSPAVILFTSGSEGTPKGVVLSHRNLNANRLQIAARIDYGQQDTVFNALPMFHALGLSSGTLLPILSGAYTFLYPSPLHFKIVSEICYQLNATVLFGTDTFLMGYARHANPYDFYRIRLVIAGAERVKEETRAVWSEKFGLRIFEGYGATECSPVLSLNTPMYNRIGTTGRLLDGIEAKLEPIPGFDQGGRLSVKGPNIMLGYLRNEKPGVIEAPADGWYDTGDIVDLDPQKFITILGRAKRFAKIGGEMVSLGGLETKLTEAFPEKEFAIVTLPDDKKGEQLVLFTTLEKPDRKQIGDALKARGATELMVPRDLRHIEAIPLLGSGKTDYVTLGKMAAEKNAEAAD